MSYKSKQMYEFGDFRLEPETPSLWRGMELVSISPKALEILVLLILKNGEIASREELLEKVWNDSIVEEANLNYNISLLRKSLGSKSFIQTVPKRGYRFAGEIKIVANAPADLGQPEDAKVYGEIGRRNFASSARFIAAAVLLLLLFSFAGYYYYFRTSTKLNVSAAPREIKSLAVLPFSNFNADDDDASITLGLTDSLISRLGSLKRFSVRPFGSVEKFGRRGVDVIQAGKTLKCDAVLVGTLQTVGDRIQVNVQLLDVSNGSQIWSSKFDETSSDIFILQTNLATEVAGFLLQQLNGTDEKILGKRYTENPEAYRAYLRGRVIFNQRIDNAFQQVLDEYQKAISLDPTFALGYSGLADLFSRLGNGKSGAESIEAYKLAKKYARKALEMDADLAEAHSSLARILRVSDWDWVAAEKEFKRAIELDPNNATALAWYAQMLSFLGRHDEAKAAIDRAIEIDPITPAVTGVLFPVIEGRKEFAEGLVLAEKAYQFDKENQNSRRSYVTFLYYKGEFEKVIDLSQKFSADNPKTDHVWLSLLSASYFKTGQTEKSLEYFRKIEAESKTNTKFLYSLGVLYAETGQLSEAIAALQNCFELREERIVWINTDPRLDVLKNEPAFRDLVKKLNLE